MGCDNPTLLNRHFEKWRKKVSYESYVFGETYKGFIAVGRGVDSR